MNMPFSEDFTINESTMPMISQLAERMPGGFFIYHADGAQELIAFNSFMPALFGCGDDGSFRALTGNSFRGIVHPEDYERVESSIREQIANSADKVDHVRYRFLRTDGSVGMMDDYGHFSRSEAFGDIFYVFVQDITAQWESELEEKQRGEQRRKKLIADISETESTYIVVPETDSFTVISRSRHLEAHYPAGESFTESITRYIGTDVFGPDRKAAAEAFALPALIRNSENGKEYRFRYRDISSGRPRWYEARAVRLSESEILFGFSDRDREIHAQLLFDKLQENYFGLYYVNLESGMVQIIKTAHPEELGEPGSYVEYGPMVRRIAATCEGETAEFLDRLSDIRELKSLFTKEDIGYYSYQSQGFENKVWVHATGFVLMRKKDGTPTVFALGFTLLDEDSSRKEEAQRKLRELTERLEAENHHNTILNRIIKAGPWLFKYDRDIHITETVFSEECVAVLRNDVKDGMQWLSLIHPEDRERVIASFSACVGDAECNTPFDAEYRVLSRGGEYHWIHSAGRMRWNGDGTGEFYGICTDIDETVRSREEERKKLAAALAEAEEEKRRNDTIHDIIHSGKWSFFVNERDEIVGSDVSAEANSILRNEVPADGHSWLNIVHPDDRGPAAEAFYAAIRDHSGKTPYDVNYRMIGSDGVYRWFHSAGRVIRDRDGNGEFFGIHVDITDRMEEQQRRLLGAVPLSSDILTKARIGLWAFELDEGRAPRMYADEAMLGLLGLTEQLPPEEIWHAWSDRIDEGSRELVNDAVEKMISGEHAEVQYPWHHPDGHTMIVRCGGVRNNGYVKGIRIEGTHQDVSETIRFDEEERRREEQRREAELARVAAESASRAKTEFLFNMSHDIRTPMNAILGYTDIALKHIGEAERVGDSLRKIRLSGDHLLNLINDILEMSRIEAGRLVLSAVPVNVREAAEGTETMSRALAAGKNIAFGLTVGELRDPWVWADELHVNQIVINLISNAVKYTNPGGTVDYRVCQIGEAEDGIARYRISVSDNGIGMTEEFQEHLFESFSRESSEDVSRQEGAGLGLAIVRRIVDALGGTISVRSRKGEGSTFTVELPLKVMSGAEIERFLAERGENTSAADESSLKGKRVLLVEDNELNREIAAELLGEAGLLVDAAEDGETAVRRLAENGTDSCDFVLMDIRMPGMNGYEATAAVRRLPGGSRLPIIALSANAFAEDRAASAAAGMDAHVAKPIDMAELVSVLTGILR